MLKEGKLFVKLSMKVVNTDYLPKGTYTDCLISYVIISVCETVYHQKNVTEVQPTCKTIMMPMCMKNENGVENCVQIPRKVQF